MRFEHNLYIVGDHFKHIGDSQYLEIVTTAEEIMPFHDHGVVVCRFGRSSSEPSGNIDFCHLLVNRRP